MKTYFIGTALASALLATCPAYADELLGADLLKALSGNSFDCLQGEVPLEWQIAELTKDAHIVPYTAVVKGKTIQAEYEMTPEGRLTSDSYGAERRVEMALDGTLVVTRSDGRSMTCRSR